MDKKIKEKFIFNWIKRNDGHIDTMNAYFVDEYIDLFNPKKINYKMWGADNVPELTALLKEMYDSLKLGRNSVGIPDRPSGFPKWAWCYYKK